MDIINIKDLEIFAHHGVLMEENVLGQKFLVSAKLFVHTREAGQNDDLEKSVNYALVCNEIKAFMENNTFKLIETVAEKTAEMLLIKFNGIRKIEIEIKKPWAPILQSVDYVSVKIERGWKKAYLSMGSNIGDSKGYLENGIMALRNNEKCRVTKVSPFYKTKPVGEVEQDDFLNCCVEIETLLFPYELLAFVNEIEKENNRERLIHWGPRTLDIDIVLFEGCVISEESLTIPHIEMANREFVLRPLRDIAPYEVHPVLNKSVTEMFNEITKEV